jgi:cyanophycinase
MKLSTSLCRVLFYLLLQATTCVGAANRQLILIGGGAYPAEALVQLTQRAGGKDARLLVFCWATEVPEDSFNHFLEKLEPYKTASIEMAPVPGRGRFDASFVVNQIQTATGIFFTGGDQVFAMERLNAAPTVKAALVQRYKEGVVFGGTSAGTALMSEVMLTGNGDFSVIDPAQVETIAGLGLATGVILDQHFIKRQRLNRLLSVLTGAKENVALGVDEDGAVSLDNESSGKVLGPAKVIRLQKNSRGQILMNILGPGEEFSL